MRISGVAGTGALVKVNANRLVPDRPILRVHVTMAGAVAPAFNDIQLFAAQDYDAPMLQVFDGAALNWADPVAVAAAGILYDNFTGPSPIGDASPGDLSFTFDSSRSFAFDLWLNLAVGVTATVWIT